MLERLERNPDDYLSAFKSLPQSLQILMVHSLQSLAFNHTMRARLAGGMEITPIIGDIVAQFPRTVDLIPENPQSSVNGILLGA